MPQQSSAAETPPAPRSRAASRFETDSEAKSAEDSLSAIGRSLPDSIDRSQPLALVSQLCCLCKSDDADPVGVGEDFEHRSGPDTFLAMRCRTCGVVYLKLRPAMSELSRIYPPEYHAFNFSEQRFGLVYRIRRRLEAHRLLQWCRGIGPIARILDVGCGDGFHLRLLRDFGAPGWELEGVDSSIDAVGAARAHRLTVHHGTVQELSLPRAQYDLVLLIMTIEHVNDPVAVLTAIRSLLRPGGRVVVITDNTATWSFRLAGGRYWGGYHFPRHWYLFERQSLRRLADGVGLEVQDMTTLLTPLNWLYSIHNALVDWRAPSWLVNRFTMRSWGALTLFTLFDGLQQLAGRGGILQGIFQRPAEPDRAGARNHGPE